MSLFVAAFDDAFVYRYDATNRQPKEKIEVRYINGPKHRILADLNDRAKSLTLPVVTMEQTSLTRDSNRIFNKDQFIYRLNQTDNYLSKIPTPIPVSMDVNVSIICYFKEDLEQILQNFIVNCNPYIIVSWKTPEQFKLPFLEEIRSEIQWSGSVSYNNPKDLSPDTKWRISADTTFTIKGWLFKSYDQTQKPIYTVNTNFINSDLNKRFCDYTYTTPTTSNGVDIDKITYTAIPSFTNLFYAVSSMIAPVFSNLIIKSSNDNGFLIYGKRFSYNNSWYLSSNVPNFYSNYELVSSANNTTVSAYRLPESAISVTNDNIASISIPRNTLSAAGNFTILTSNEAGWASYSDYIITNQTY